MAFDIRLISLHEFLRTDVTGSVDFDQSVAILEGVAASSAQSGITRVLIDGRQATAPEMTPADILSLAMKMPNIGLDRGHRIAILTGGGEEHRQGRLLQEYATEQGMTVGAFTDFEPCLAWLEGRSL